MADKDYLDLLLQPGPVDAADLFLAGGKRKYDLFEGVEGVSPPAGMQQQDPLEAFLRPRIERTMAAWEPPAGLPEPIPEAPPIVPVETLRTWEMAEELARRSPQQPAPEEELEALEDLSIPPGIVALRDREGRITGATTEERVRVLGGKAGGASFLKEMKVSDYLTHMNPDEPGISEEEAARRRKQYGKMGAEAQLNAGTTAEGGQARLDGIYKVRMGALLGSPADIWRWGEEREREKSLPAGADRQAALAAVPSLAQTPGAVTGTPGILHPLVALSVGALDPDGTHPERADRAAQRLAKVTLEYDPGQKTFGRGGFLRGFDLERIKEVANRSTLSLDQSIFLLGLSGRAVSDESLAKALDRPDVQRIFMDPTAPGYDPAHPERADADLEIARARAMRQFQDLSVSMGRDFDSHFRVERDEKGNILPATYAEDPEHWRTFAQTANLGDIEVRAARAEVEGDSALAGLLYEAHGERADVRPMSWGKTAWNLPASAGRTVVGVIEMYLAGAIHAVNVAKWGLEYSHTKAIGGEGAADREWAQRWDAAEKGLGEAVGGFADMVLKTSAAPFKALGFDTMTDREYAQWKLDFEHDPVGVALVGAMFVQGAFQVTGAARNMHRVATDGALKAATEGVKQGTAAWARVMRAKTLLGAVGSLADVAYRPIARIKARRLGKTNADWLRSQGMDSPAVLNERIRAVEQAAKDLGDSAGEVALKKAMDQEIAGLKSIESSVTALEAATSKLAAVPGYGRFLKKWFSAPGAMQSPELLQKYMKVAGNRGWKGAMEADAEAAAAYAQLEGAGVPKATARLLSMNVLEGMGQFADKVAWDLARPYRGLAESAHGAGKTAGKFNLGKLEFDVAQIEADAAKQGVDPVRVVENILARELEAFKPRLVLPKNFAQLTKDLAARHMITEGQARFKWITWELERLAAVGRRPGPAVETGGLGVRMPEITEAAGGVRVFDWNGTQHEIRPTVVKMPGKGNVGRYSVWTPEGEIAKTRSTSAQETLRRFLDETQPQRGEGRRYYTQALDVPEITGIEPEALRFALAADWAMGDVAAKVGGTQAATLAGFYDALLKSSPLLKALPDAWSRYSAALEIMRQVRPVIELDPAIPKGETLRVRDGKGERLIPFEDVFRAIGKPIENWARFEYETALKLADVNFIPKESLLELGLRHAHRILRPEARKAKGRAQILRRLAREREKWTGISRKERAAYVAQLEAELEAGPPRQASPEHPYSFGEMDAGISGVAPQLLPGGEALLRREVLAQTRLPGPIGQEVYKRVYDVSREGVRASKAATVMSNATADMVQTIRAMGAHVGLVAKELLGGGTLSPEVAKFVGDRVGAGALETLDPARRLAYLVEVLRKAEAISVPPELLPRLKPYLEAAGLKSPRLQGVTDKASTTWARDVLVSPETQYLMEHVAGPSLTQAGYQQTLAQITRWIKGNQIVYQSGPWVRDMLANWAILGPANGLMPTSRAWGIGFELAETENPVSGALRAAGQSGGPLSETNFAGGETIPRGIRNQIRELVGKFGQDLDGEIAGAPAGIAALKIGWLSMKLAADLSFSPGKTALGKFLSYHRSMTDWAARTAMLSQKVALEVAQDAEFLNHLDATARKHGVRVAGRNPTMPWAKEEVVLATAKRIARRAYQERYRQARKTVSKGTARDLANAAMGKAYDEVFTAAWKRIPAERASVIVDETVKAFTDYNDKPKIIDAMSKNPFGPIYSTWSAQQIPRIAGKMLRNPVRTLASKGLYEVFGNLLWAETKGEQEGSFRDFEKSSPYWSLVLPLSGDIEFTGQIGESLLMSAGIDASFMHPFSIGPDVANPLQSPAGSVLEGAMQLVSSGRSRESFPRKRGEGIFSLFGEPGGAPRVEPTAEPGQKWMQLAANEFAKLEPATSPFALVRALLGHTGALETGPYPAGYRAPSTWQPLVEAVEGPAKPEQPTARIGAGLARVFGWRVVPVGEEAALYRLVAPEQVTERAKERAKDRGGGAVVSRSLLGYAKQRMREQALAPVNRFEAALDAARGKLQRKGKANLTMGGDDWREVERREAALQRANQLYAVVDKRVSSILDTYQAAAWHEWGETPPSERWMRSQDLQLVVDAAQIDVRERFKEVIELTLEGKALPEAERPSDVRYQVLEKAALEYVMEPLNRTMNSGFTPGAPEEKTPITLQQVIAKLDSETESGTATSRYFEQQTTQPEAAIRTKTNRAALKRKGGPSLLMGAEPVPEEIEK